MTGKSRPCAAQGTGTLHSGVAVQDNAFAEGDHYRVAMHPDPVAGLDLDIAVKLHMRVEMFGRLFDFDAARRVELLGGEQPGHAAGSSSMSANILL
jgi:hypothetical protein